MSPCESAWLVISFAAGWAAAAGARAAVAEGPVTLINSSIQAAAVDSKALSQSLGRRVDMRTDLGAMSCMKFCMVRSVCRGKDKPALVVLEDRHNYMMIPNLRAGGKYWPRIEKRIGADAELRGIIEKKALALPWTTYGGPGPVNIGSWDFPGSVEASLLPDFIRECRAAGVILVVCCFRASWNASNQPTPEMKKYRQDFAAYMQKHGARLLDYTECPEITLEMYKVGEDHMNPTGRAAFTRLLAEDLRAMLDGKRGLRELTDPAQAGLSPPTSPQTGKAAPGAPGAEAVGQAYLDQLRELERRLQAVQGRPAKYEDTPYFARNRAALVQMTGLAQKILREFGATPAADAARRIISQYGLPEKSKVAANAFATVDVTVEAAPVVPHPRVILPYLDALRYVRCHVDRVVKGDCGQPTLVVVHWAILEGKPTEAALWKAGTRLRLEVDLFDAHPELAEVTNFLDAKDAVFAPHLVLQAKPWGGGTP